MQKPCVVGLSMDQIQSKFEVVKSDPNHINSIVAIRIQIGSLFFKLLEFRVGGGEFPKKWGASSRMQYQTNFIMIKKEGKF